MLNVCIKISDVQNVFNTNFSGKIDIALLWGRFSAPRLSFMPQEQTIFFRDGRDFASNANISAPLHPLEIKSAPDEQKP